MTSDMARLLNSTADVEVQGAGAGIAAGLERAAQLADFRKRQDRADFEFEEYQAERARVQEQYERGLQQEQAAQQFLTGMAKRRFNLTPERESMLRMMNPKHQGIAIQEFQDEDERAQLQEWQSESLMSIDAQVAAGLLDEAKAEQIKMVVSHPEATPEQMRMALGLGRRLARGQQRVQQKAQTFTKLAEAMQANAHSPEAQKALNEILDGLGDGSFSDAAAMAFISGLEDAQNLTPDEQVVVAKTRAERVAAGEITEHQAAGLDRAEAHPEQVAHWSDDDTPVFNVPSPEQDPAGSIVRFAETLPAGLDDAAKNSLIEQWMEENFGEVLKPEDLARMLEKRALSMQQHAALPGNTNPMVAERDARMNGKPK